MANLANSLLEELKASAYLAWTGSKSQFGIRHLVLGMAAENTTVKPSPVVNIIVIQTEKYKSFWNLPKAPISSNTESKFKFGDEDGGLSSVLAMIRSMSKLNNILNFGSFKSFFSSHDFLRKSKRSGEAICFCFSEGLGSTEDLDKNNHATSKIINS